MDAPDVAGALLLNVAQSVDAKYPSTKVVAFGMLIAGVVPPLDTIGAVPVTAVTDPVEVAVNVPPVNDSPVPTVTLLNPPNPLP